MKYLLAAIILITVHCVTSIRRPDQVSEYRFKTVHTIPEKKTTDDTDFEEKLEVLSKILRKQNSRKTEVVAVKTETQPEQPKADSYEEPKKKDDEKPSVPRYEFSYGVKDPKTGDRKEQWEKRVGGQVKGHYKFAESDGTQRVVEYEADDDKGFEAKVKNVEAKFSEEEEEEKEEEEEEKKVEKKPTKGGEKVAESYSYLKKYFK